MLGLDDFSHLEAEPWDGADQEPYETSRRAGGRPDTSTQLATGSLGTFTTRTDALRWRADLHVSDLSPNTVAKVCRVLKVSFDGAVDAGLIKHSPCTVKGAGTEHHDETRIATPEQLTDLATAIGPHGEARILCAALRYQHVIDGQDADIVKYSNASANSPTTRPRTTVRPVRERGDDEFPCGTVGGERA